jgi:hypothetical protein
LLEVSTGFGFLVGFGVDLGLALGVTLGVTFAVALGVAFGVAFSVKLAFGLVVAFGFTVGCGVGVGVLGAVDPAVTTGDVGWVACRCGRTVGVGVGDALPGIASRYGATAGSAFAEFQNPLRPDQLSANAVNATTTTAKATNASDERRGHLLSYSLNTGTG